MIYFLEAQGLGIFKIGFTHHLYRRCKVIQATCPVPLKLVRWVRGGLKDERLLFMLFHKERLHGEWFKDSPALRELLAKLHEGQTFQPEMLVHK